MLSQVTGLPIKLIMLVIFDFSLITKLNLPRINSDMAMTKILLDALATAYVRGVTSDSTEKAKIF